MATQGEMEIYRQQRQGQDKYVYFLLAAVGASIAFALNQTKGLALSPTQWPLGIAVACWAGSFLMGCSRLVAMETMLNLNVGLLRAQRGSHDLIEHPAEIPFAIEAVRKHLEKANKQVVSRAHWQYRLLVVGAAFYIGWHIYEMALRT